MLTIDVSLSESQESFIDKMVAEGHAASRVEFIIRALEEYAQAQTMKTAL